MFNRIETPANIALGGSTCPGQKLAGFALCKKVTNVNKISKFYIRDKCCHLVGNHGQSSFI